MIAEAQYHEKREAEERAIAASLAEGEARERHLELAGCHADRAWLIRKGYRTGMADAPVDRPISINSTDHGIAQAIRRSRELIAQSHRVLAESRGVAARR